MATTRAPRSAAPKPTELESLARDWLKVVSLEEMLTHPLLFGLTTATPLQRAICRVAEGRPLGSLALDPAVRRNFPRGYTGRRPRELALVAGVRSGKSLIAAAMLLHAAMQADLSGLKPGDIPRAVVVSAKKDNAKAIYRHLVGAIKASPVLRRMLASDPDNSTSTFMVRRPDGVLVEVLIVAMSTEGVGLTSFWIVFCGLDEYARMTGDDSEGVLNWADQRRAVFQRIRPGGYLIHTSSPTGEDGPAYRHVQDHWQNPTEDIVVVRGRGDELNPTWWTPERIEQAKKDPDSYLTDALGEFGATETQHFHGTQIDLCLRSDDGDLPYDPRASYTAWMDPATRGNGWTFAVWTRDAKTRVMAAGREWIGSRAKPLDPEEVFCDCGSEGKRDHLPACGGIAPICIRYGVTCIGSDGWSGDALAAIAARYGLTLAARSTTTEEEVQRYLDARTVFALGEASLPRIAQMRADLIRVKKRTGKNVSMVLPKTSDGRHCDWAPTIVGGLSQYVDDLRPVEDSPDERLEREAIEASLRMYAREHGEDDDE